MPIENLGKMHLTPEQMQEIDTALQRVVAILKEVSPNFTDEERQRFGSVNEKNKLITNKVWDYRRTQPQLSSPDINWEEYERDFISREFSSTRLHLLATIQRLMSDFKIAHDFDNYQDALIDYRYAQYKTDTNTAGFAEKMKDIQQLFPNS